MTLEEKFAKFHAENPKVYRLFDRFAMEAVAAGRLILSAKLIFERIRWETTVITAGDEYKLNNNYHAYYARLWMKRNPYMMVKFRTRAVRGDRIAA